MNYQTQDPDYTTVKTLVDYTSSYKQCYGFLIYFSVCVFILFLGALFDCDEEEKTSLQ